jgi:diguanylate cyclase (GGDEF)-like protein
VRVSGVLNLSDKRNQGIFTNSDMELLTPFASHIAAMMQKNSVQEQVAMLERLSITDPLTELYNRRFLERRMEEEINRSMRNGSTLTIMMIDLDHFKTYNDLCGHIAGDRALEKVARVLCASVRDMDVVTRYGGEEFCVLLPGTTKRESLFVANRIRRDIENELFPGEEKLPFGRLTTSIGISSFPGDGVTATAVINAADIALYEAKSAGRNRIMIFSSRGPGERPQASSPVPLIT